MAIVILFVFAGPALGGVTGGVALAGAAAAGSGANFWTALFGFFPAAALFSLYGAVFGYWLGFVPAFAAGAVIAWHEGWRGPVTGFSAVLLGVAVGALYYMFSEFFDQEAGAYGAAFGVLVCVVPSYVLWRVVRFWGRGDPPAALASSQERA